MVTSVCPTFCDTAAFGLIRASLLSRCGMFKDSLGDAFEAEVAGVGFSVVFVQADNQTQTTPTSTNLVKCFM